VLVEPPQGGEVTFKRARLPLIATCAAGVLLFAGCGSDNKSSTDTTAAATTAAATTAAPTTAAPTTAAPTTTAPKPTTTAPKPTTTAAKPTTTAAPATTAAGGTPNPATEEADVTKAFIAVFDGFKADPAFLQDYDKYKAGVAQLQGSDSAKQLTVKINGVTAADAAACTTAGVTPPCAAVKFDLLVSGTPAIPDNNGFAVFEDGVWKVSGTTYCSLAVLGTPNPSGCV
jgi:hypothetical protein